MKKIKNIIVSLTLVAVIACTSVTAFAALPPLFIGDVDNDGGVTISDATMIQRALAKLTTLTKRQQFAADTSGVGEYSILDATQIQRKLAGLPYEFYEEYIYGLWASVENFYADYASGKAMTGTPINFTVVGEGFSPLTYAFFINGEIVQERSENATLTYTFDTAGEYDITAKVYNGFDDVDSYSLDYTVVEPYPIDKVTITNAYFNHIVDRLSKSDVAVCVAGGTAPYKYQYTITGPMPRVDDIPQTNIGEYTVVEDEATQGGQLLTTGYVDSNVTHIPAWDLEHGGPYTLTIVVKDANGVESEPYTLSYIGVDIPR